MKDINKERNDSKASNNEITEDLFNEVNRNTTV
jgi:hypothetical protein